MVFFVIHSNIQVRKVVYVKVVFPGYTQSHQDSLTNHFLGETEASNRLFPAENFIGNLALIATLFTVETGMKLRSLSLRIF